MTLWKGLAACALALFVLASQRSEAGTIYIADDPGGRIGIYVDKFAEMNASQDRVVIDGLCASACTLIFGYLPRERVCVTTNAVFGFHSAYDIVDDRVVTNEGASDMLWAAYPSPVRKWITKRGGLTRRMVYLKGESLRRMQIFEQCGPKSAYARHKTKQ